MEMTDMDTEKDIEAGLSEERDNLQPLLGGFPNDGRGLRVRPQGPINLGPFDSNQNQTWEPNLSAATSEETLYPSANSTANNTPLTEVPDAFPRKWRRSDRRLRRLNTELLEAIEGHNVEEVERLLNAGANPNATCRLGLISACHCAAIAGGDSLSLLLKFGADKHRLDKLGRTPLHLAAWAGNARQMAILLDFPEDMQTRVENESMSSEAEEDVRKLNPKTKTLANIRCDLGEVTTLLPKTWKDNIDHNCKNIIGTLPVIQPGWTPLHVASACNRPHCTRLLLAAGGDPNICDVAGRTALDVAGFSYYYDVDVKVQCFTEVIRLLLEAGGTFNTMRPRGINNMDTPLHTAVAIEGLDATNLLLTSGASSGCLNSAGQTPLHVCVLKELEEPLQVLANYGSNTSDPLSAMVDVKDAAGRTVLQVAVAAAWVPGVCIALEAGADVTLKANNSETPIHIAAALGNLDVLSEILSIAKQRDFIDCRNDEGETPLLKAVQNGHLDCVKALVDEGANIKITLRGDVNVLHIAAEKGHLEILRYFLEYDEDKANILLNALTAGEKDGYGPIHFAVANNHADCVEFLLLKNADIRLRTTSNPGYECTPLHIAAVKNHLEIAKILLNFDKTTIHEVNSIGWYPLHSAGYFGSRDVIVLLLREGADLSCNTGGPKKYRKTAIDLIINNLSKPTDFLEEVFDSYISTNNRNLQDADCEIKIDYRILMPCVCEMEQMKVIQALIKTGNRCGQKRLLVHPLVESFLYLKWKALLPFFYTIIAMYALFVMSVTTFVISVFFYKDTHDSAPAWLNPQAWCYVVYVTISLLLLQELLYMNVKSSHYFLQLETWVKFGSIGLAAILPLSVIITSWSEGDWSRHVATLALLLSWVELMFLLSRFPNWGYYVLMFGKVASNVVKILFTFAFLVIGFALAFMLQFRSQMPFEGPWAAFVKTMVMMTSEFDYVALFDEDHSRDLATSLVIVRVIFVVFLILASIVLMNLMVGVAVNDINDLEILGNIKRLAKQVEFLETLDTLVYNKVFTTLLPTKINKSVKRKRNVVGILTLCPVKPRWRRNKLLPSRLRDAIMDKAVTQKKQMDNELGLQRFKTQVDEMYETIIKTREEQDKRMKEYSEIDKLAKNKIRHDEIVKHLSNLDDDMEVVKEQLTATVKESKSEIEQLNVKMDHMSLEIEVIKQILSRMESKLGTLRQ